MVIPENRDGKLVDGAKLKYDSASANQTVSTRKGGLHVTDDQESRVRLSIRD